MTHNRPTDFLSCFTNFDATAIIGQVYNSDRRVAIVSSVIARFGVLGGSHVKSEVGGVHESEQLSALIGDIYDTTLDRSLWPRVLKKTAQFVPGVAAAVYWNDAASRSGDVYFDDGGIDQRYRALYFEKYIKLNPTATRHFFAEVGEPTATADLLPYDEFLQSRFYLEWARPQGLVDFISAALEKATTSAAMYGVFRHERHGRSPRIDRVPRRL